MWEKKSLGVARYLGNQDAFPNPPQRILLFFGNVKYVLLVSYMYQNARHFLVLLYGPSLLLLIAMYNVAGS